MSKNHLTEVAVALPLYGTFTYGVPENLKESAEPGARVLVPFGNRMVTGYVTGLESSAPEKARIKDIIDVLDPRPPFPPGLLKDLLWMAEYYVSPPGETLKGALPSGINVESSARLTLTPKGEKALADDRTRQSDREILARIASDPGISQKNLLALRTENGKALKALATRTAITRMASTGLIAREESVGKAKISERFQSMACISAMPPRAVEEIVSELSRRAPARARVLAYIDSSGEVPVPELSRRFPNASAIVKILEKEGIVTTRRARVWRDPSLGDIPEYEKTPPTLTQHQNAALEAIIPPLESRSFAPFLLHGITGSGKTEVYLRAIASALGTGRQALVLVPEISLTPQLLGRFRARFGDEVAILHSALGRGERLDEWTRVRDGMVRVAIGARSAVFAPFDNLGLIVVDEEHDGGYKQEEKTPYNARDFAMIRGRSNNAVVILGSATPSMESYHNARIGRYGLLKLPERVESRPLPEVTVVDLKSAGKGRSQFISPLLEEEMAANLERRRQTILFLNRRGYAPFLMCLKCGHTFGCPSCSVSLTYHQKQRKLMCHFCDFHAPVPNVCPGCGGADVKMVGIGTERIEEEISRILPSARVGRLDRDTVSRKGEMSRILGALREGSLDILVGTQMIAKGHDYPGVTLVGVIMAETSLNFPDFRAAETTFSLLTQVAGRAGRGKDPGKVVVQTYNPDNYAIRLALGHDYEGFVKEELKNRRELGYPPFKRLTVVRISGPSQASARNAAKAASDAARKCSGIRVLGPAPAPWSKIKSMYRWQILIKSDSAKASREAAKFVIDTVSDRIKSEKSRISVDVDPIRLL